MVFAAGVGVILLICSRTSPFQTENKNCFFTGLNFIENSVGADSAPPDIILTLHFLDIAEERIKGKNLNYFKNNLGVSLRHSFENFKNSGVNA